MKKPVSRNQPSLVRPYTLTAGRTTTSIALPLEAPIETVESASHDPRPPGDVRTDIVQLCTTTPSLAEIASRLELPIGVARVLVGDLVQAGSLRVLTTLADDSSDQERRELIGRTLRGLRAL
ncbi:MAG TPA: DUF742 domain-containing protein [Mycobacterium sp.]|jgi:hypothetical protein